MTAAGDGAVPDPVEAMLAVTAALPTTGGYGLEWKWDGFRCCMRVGPTGATRLTSRIGNDITATFPELVGELAPALGGRTAVVDGEIVAFDRSGLPDFGLLQRRHQVRPNPALLAEVPVTFLAFDLLRLGDTLLLAAPYRDRRRLLEDLVPTGRVVVPAGYTDQDIDPADMLRAAEEQGLEGVVAKRLDSPYLPGRRSDLWIKSPLVHTLEVIVLGWRSGRGRRDGMIGALLLGAHDRDTGELHYVGDVGTGFTEAMLDHLLRRLRPLARPTSPAVNPVPREKAHGAHWVRPELVGEVVYRRFTHDRKLRHTSWRGLRPDRDPAEVRAPDSGPPGGQASAAIDGT